MSPPVSELSFLDDLFGIKGIIVSQILAIGSPLLQQLLGKIISIVSAVEFEEV